MNKKDHMQQLYMLLKCGQRMCPESTEYFKEHADEIIEKLNNEETSDAKGTVIKVPVRIGDTIYEKCTKIISCRFFGDKYAREDGTPHCLQHEYDCDPENGMGCDAKLGYFVKPVVVNDIIFTFFVNEILGYNNETGRYLLSKADAEKWLEQVNSLKD